MSMLHKQTFLENVSRFSVEAIIIHFLLKTVLQKTKIEFFPRNEELHSATLQHLATPAFVLLLAPRASLESLLSRVTALPYAS